MFDAGKLRIAANLCREVLNTDGKNLEVLDLFAAILIKAGLNEKAVNVLEDPNIRIELSKHSNWPTIPQLFVNGELIGGCDIAMELHNSGQLHDVLNKVN